MHLQLQNYTSVLGTANKYAVFFPAEDVREKIEIIDF